MSRLPVVGGDVNTWGTVLNDFLDASFGFFRLSADTNVGASTITVDRLPGIIAANAGHYIIVDPFTTEAELRLVTGVSGKQLSIAALAYGHNSSDYVYFITGTQGTLIPWTWWGGKGNANSADATNNVTAFNRLTTEIHDVAGHGIGVDGTFCVNNELEMFESQTLVGNHVFSSKILAVSGFPFDDSGSVAIIHPRRTEGPVLYEQGGPSGRWWFRNIYVDGGNLADSNGIISSPQQPDSTENVRITNCAGKYALSLNDVQYHDLRNLHFDNNYRDIHMWNCAFVRFYNVASTSTQGPVSVDMIGVVDSSFYGGLFESMLNPGILLSATAGSSRLGFYDIYTSGPGGVGGTMFYFDSEDNPSAKCTYIITNARCSLNDDGVYMVQDVQRSITINSQSDTQRALIFGYAQNDMYQFVLGSGTIETSGPVRLAPFSTGPMIMSGSGVPSATVPVGSLFMRTDGGVGTTLYVRESGGWVAK